MRNPWRFSFDRLTGALLVGDVGQSGSGGGRLRPGRRRAGAGVNFGWDCREGRHDVRARAAARRRRLTDPILEYPNPPGPAAITGGYVVRDPSLGDLYGRYLYADVYAGPVRSLVPALPDAAGDRTETLSVGTPVSFGEDSCARVYIASALGTRLPHRRRRAGRLLGDRRPRPRPRLPAPPPPVPAGDLRRRGGDDRLARAVEGTPGDDVIAGSDGADRIRGRGGDDLICALDGADRLRGGGGADRLRGGRGADRCRGGAGKTRSSSC